MKGKSKYFVLLLLLLVVCSGLVTYALFRTNKSGSANINAARWNVVFKNGEEEISNNFDINLNNAIWTNELGNVATGKIAPGSYSTFYITIDASNTETDVDYTVEVDESFNVSDFEVTLADDAGTIPYSTTSGAMIKQIPIRVVWNGTINDSNTKNNDDLLKKARDITIPIKLTAAQKLALKYTVTFNDGFGNVLSTKKVDEGSTIGTLPASPTKVGYTFSGWFDENDNQITNTTPITSAITLYAHYEIKNVTVTFNSNGGSNVSSQKIPEGSTISTLPTTTKSGYTFAGWFNGNNELTTSTQIMNNVTYTAKWSRNVTLGQVVYYDPVSTNTCNSSTFNLNNVKNGTSTCYKWRVIDVDTSGNNSNIQMDHNLVNDLSLNSSNQESISTIFTKLANATSSWKESLLLDYTYDTSALPKGYGTINCINGNCTISKTGTTITNVKARLITGEEVANITKTQAVANSIAHSWSLTTGNWYFFSNLDYKTGTITSGTGNTNLSWMIENTFLNNKSRSTANLYGDTSKGYLTLSPTGDSIYRVCYGGHIGSTCGQNAVENVVRPVITVPKTDLN